MEICNYNDCTGYGACFNACPTKCIEMIYCDDGFLIPKIDDEKCTNCGQCKKVCPSLKENINVNFTNPITVGAWSKDKKILKKSTSGGVFSVLAEYTFNNGGVVVGCVMDNQLTPFHTIAYSMDEIEPMQGSKYLQSEIRDIYVKVKKILEKGQDVLFTGCPCQIAGLYSILKNKSYKNLTTVDLVCHGVGSKLFFDSYINEINKKYNNKVSSISFRNKDSHINNYASRILFNDGKKAFIKKTNDSYLCCYLKKAIYRESCYSCQYACIPRISDFSIGDFIGINRNLVSKDDFHRGVSVILINNEKSQVIFNKIKSNLNWVLRPLSEASTTNYNICNASVRPKSRDKIFKYVNSPKLARKMFCMPSIGARLSVSIVGKNVLLLASFNLESPQLVNHKIPHREFCSLSFF